MEFHGGISVFCIQSPPWLREMRMQPHLQNLTRDTAGAQVLTFCAGGEGGEGGDGGQSGAADLQPFFYIEPLCIRSGALPEKITNHTPLVITHGHRSFPIYTKIPH